MRFMIQQFLSTFMSNQSPEKVFVDIKSSEEATVMESVCTQCFESGETRILLTKIPFFRQIMITSFSCDKCGNHNNEVQFAGELPDFGVDILFRVMQKQDINREIIKSEFAQINIPELDLQIPESKKAQITTVEGLLMRVSEELSLNQEIRKEQDLEQYNQIQAFLAKLKEYQNGQKFPLTIKITDPSGNSNIKNPFAPKQDKNLQITYINRSLEDLTRMGYSLENARQQMKDIQIKKLGNKMNFSKPFEESEFMKYEPVIFEVPCHSCQMPGQMKMCQVSVPYFTDLCIMSFVCDYCGAHSTQTKNAGQIKNEGCLITLNCENDDDLKRDLFKSETCSVEFPQIELQLDYGTLGGVYTTVEGIIQKIHDHLSDKNPFTDSDQDFHNRMSILLGQLLDMREGRRKFKIILRDPLGHSFLQNPYHPNEDPRAERHFYKRTQEEDDMLGISDMKVENYQEHSHLMKKQNHKVLDETKKQE